MVGWTDGAYRAARRSHADWASRVDRARETNRRLEDPARVSDGVPSSFQGFVAKFFPDRQPHMPHQLQLVDTLQSVKPREVVLFLLWPEAGKSSTIEDYIGRKLAMDPGHRFRIASQTQDHARRMIGFVKGRMTDVTEWPEYIGRFGPFYEKGQERKGKPWGADEFTVYKNPGTERDRSVVASSWSSATSGSRIDTVILDDLNTSENYNQSEDIFNRVRDVFFNRGAGIRTVIVGTRVGPGDFYERLMDAGLVTRKIEIPAMDGDGNPKIPEWWEAQPVKWDIRHAEGNPCCWAQGTAWRPCPADGSLLTGREYMELIRKQSGEKTWWSHYQQSPKAKALSTFGEFLEGCFDHDRPYGPLKAA